MPPTFFRPAPAPAPARSINAICLALAAALCALLAAFSIALWQSARAPLLLLPAIGGLQTCLNLGQQGETDAACTGPQGSAARPISAVLDPLGPPASADGRLALGYTLVIPLLNLFRPDPAAPASAEGRWAINEQAVQRIVRTIEQTPRPVALYLFSTHFSEKAPIEPALAANPDNMAATAAGPLAAETYMGQPLYPWSIARTDNPITRRREQAIAALAQALCRLPAAARQRIVAINLLGEVHHMFPSFESGMGAGRPYLITDYSAASRQGFAHWLARLYHGNIAALNAHLGSGARFTSFEQIQPPARDITTQPLEHYWQHLDAHAHGRLPVTGWAHAPGGPAWVRLYLNGRLIGRVSARHMRQDVAQARPDLGAARVGWRHDIDFTALPPGQHRLDIALEPSAPPGQPSRLIHIGTRRLNVMDAQHTSGPPAPMQAALPLMQTPDTSPEISYWIDSPADGQTLFYNPLAPLWHAWRAQQVVHYLGHFDRLMAQTCLAAITRRTQQIYPAENAGWDATRYAAEASHRPFGHTRLGINLYADATDDDTFFDWLARTRQGDYAITEFHPLRGMNAAELARVLARHHDHGAQSLSFFLHPPELQNGQRTQPNAFALNPDNPQHGSDQLYRALQTLMQQPAH